MSPEAIIWNIFSSNICYTRKDIFPYIHSIYISRWLCRPFVALTHSSKTRFSFFDVYDLYVNSSVVSYSLSRFPIKPSAFFIYIKTFVSLRALVIFNSMIPKYKLFRLFALDSRIWCLQTFIGPLTWRNTISILSHLKVKPDFLASYLLLFWVFYSYVFASRYL